MPAVTSLPVRLAEHASVGISNKVYIYGGQKFNGGLSWPDELRIYDADLDSYSTGTPFGSVVGTVKALGAVIGTKAYYWIDESLLEYDTVADSWAARLFTPYIVRVNPFFGVKNNQLYRLTIDAVNYDYTSDADATEDEVIDGIKAALDAGSPPGTISYFKSTNGGAGTPALVITRTSDAVSITDNNELDARTGSSTNAAFAVSNGKLIFFNGDENNVFRYDPGGPGWDAIAMAPGFNNRSSGVTVSGVAYFVGGAGNANFSFDESTNTWATLAVLPDSERDNSSAAVFDGKIYLLGGFDGTNYTLDVLEYDIGGDSWATAPVGMLGNEPSEPSAAGITDGIFVSGGYDLSSGGDSNPMDQAEVWLPSAQASMQVEWDVTTPSLQPFWSSMPNPEAFLRIEWDVPTGVSGSASLQVEWATGDSFEAVLSVLYDNVDPPTAVEAQVVKIEAS